MKKRIFLRKHIATVLSLIMMFIFSYKNMIFSYKSILNSVKKDYSIKDNIKSIENSMNENVYGKYGFVEAYGYMQKLMNKDEVNNFEVIKDKNNFMHYSYFATKANETDFLVSRVKALKENISNPNTKFAYIMTPDKYIEGYTEFKVGLPYSYFNETADGFLENLEKENIDYLDLRKGIKDSEIPMDKLFFKTDHHWTIEASFWGFQQLVKYINDKYNIDLDKDNFYTNKENYNFITYDGVYLGSMGRKTGIFYDGVDDFTVVYPKFNTSYMFSYSDGEGSYEAKGKFQEAIFFPDAFRMEDDIYNTDKYFSYLKGNHGFSHIINLDKPHGPKALFIKDSMAVPTISFLSTMFSEIYVVDPRYYAEDISELTNKLSLDFVFISIYPQNLVDEFFPFFKEK